MLKRSERLRSIAEFLTVGICTVTFALSALGIFAALIKPEAAGSRDFIEYWAAGHQLIRHANPFDTEAILKLERSTGYPAGIPAQMMPNPPSALVLVLPLGSLGPQAAELLWVVLLLGSLLVSLRVIRSLYGYPKNLLHLLGLSFAPVLSCLLAGQVALFLLLGLTLFLKWHISRPFMAGCSLWLCLLKPHLFLPFGVVLLLWICLKRSYRILAGTTFALVVSSAVATLSNPLVWVQYFQMMRMARVDRVLLPCLSVALRQYVFPHTLWLQCLPATVGCAWAVAYFWRRREDWNWARDGSVLMVVSVLVAPYTWFMDQAVLIPALLNGAYATRSRSLISVLALLSAVIEIAAMRGMELHSAFYLWPAPAWLIWYLLAIRFGPSIRRSEHLTMGEPVQHRQLD